VKILALLLVLSTVACVTTAQEGEEMRKDIASLKDQLKNEQALAKQEHDNLAAENKARAQQLQEALDQLNRGARKSGADLAVDLERAQNDINGVHGQLEVITHRLDAIEQANVERDKRIDGASAVVATQQKELDKAEHPTDKLAIYNLGRRKLEGGQLLRARELFSDFLKSFHSDELAPNAQYWLGETYYADKRYEDALREFGKVTKEWKGSEKAPDALLKIGMSFQALGNCQNALLFYEEVLSAHRTAPAAKVAREKQAECRKAKK
jgi:tol-pal system protein YbgF